MAYIIIFGVLSIFEGISHTHNFFLQPLLLLPIFGVCLIVTYIVPNRHVATEVFISCIVLIEWWDILFNDSEITIDTIQYALIIVISAYCLLSRRKWFLYSSISTLPLLYKLVNDSINYHQHFFNRSTYTFLIISNFAVIFHLISVVYNSLKRSEVAYVHLKNKIEDNVLELEYLSTIKSYYFNTISEELNSSLNGFLGHVNMLLSEKPSSQQYDHLSKLKANSDMLVMKINEIVNFEKTNMMQQPIQKTRFNPAIAFRSLYNSFQSIVTHKGITFKLKIDPRLDDLLVVADQKVLVQYLSQILNIALRGTGKGGNIELRLQLADLSMEEVRLTFTVLYQSFVLSSLFKRNKLPIVNPLDSLSDIQFDTEFGEGLVNQALNIQRNDLKISTSGEAGTTIRFDVSYPVAQELFIAAPSEVNALSIAGLRILIVDDEPLNIMILKKVLQSWKIHPDTAENGLQAVNLVKQNRYDVILMDINMPVMDGLEASKQIRKFQEQSKIKLKIIAVTANIQVAGDEAGPVSSIDAFILKPLKPQELFNRLIKIARDLKRPNQE